MDNTYELAATKKTPLISFDKTKGKLEIKGYSLHADAMMFYSELTRHIEEYLKLPAEETKLYIFFEYINTSSSKVIFKIISLFEALHDMGKQVELNWYAEDTDSDMVDIGETFSKALKYPTNIIEVET